MQANALFAAFIYLLAAVIAVPVAKRLGLGSVLGYLLAGVVIGPSLLGLVGEGGNAAHFGEFGVIMMLFLIGLELRPAMLWRLRGPILGMGGAQVALTVLAISSAALAVRVGGKVALALGCILAMSSTAIVLQSLAERGQLKLSGGQACFSVLLFQDIAVIPILALLPLLASAPETVPTPASALAHLPPALQVLARLGAVGAIIFAGRFLLRHAFRFIAQTRLREVFTATALLLVIGITLLMDAVGLSAALGAFLAGVVLSENEYRHQLEADIEPFKGLLLGLFFTTVGAGIDFHLVARQPGVIAGLVAALIALKFAVLLAVGRASRLEWSQALLFAFALAQGGEFCFVLFQFAHSAGVLSEEITKPLVAAVALSMALTPFLMNANDRLVQPRFTTRKKAREPDEIDEHENPVILAGFGRFGHIIGRVLRANGFGVTVLDSDPDQVEMLGRFGLKSFYGDASRLDLLHAAGAARARLFVLAIDDEVKSLEIVKTLRTEFPQLRILARAVSRQHAYELLRAGVKEVYRDTLGTALDLSADALRVLGVRANQALRATHLFKQHDEASVREMAFIPEGNAEYISSARRHMENLERALQADQSKLRADSDDGWETGLPPSPD